MGFTSNHGFLGYEGEVQKTLSKKKKIDRRKTLKNEEKEKRRIQRKSNNSNEHL